VLQYWHPSCYSGNKHNLCVFYVNLLWITSVVNMLWITSDVSLLWITSHSNCSDSLFPRNWNILQFSFICMVCRSLFQRPFVLFSFGHCLVCSSSIYEFWLPFESRINDTLWKLYSLEKGVHALICCRIKLRETNYLNNSNVQQQNHRKRDNWYP
jgi:hypothetical protein